LFGLPLWVTIGLLWKCLRWFWKTFHQRIQWASETLFENILRHWFARFPEFDRGDAGTDNKSTKDVSDTDEAADMQRKPVPEEKDEILRSPHIKRKNPMSFQQAQQLLEALKSRSLPILLKTGGAFAEDVVARYEMRDTATWVGNLLVFLEEAKRVRHERLEGRLSRVEQHEVLAQYYHDHVKVPIGERSIFDMVQEEHRASKRLRRSSTLSSEGQEQGTAPQVEVEAEAPEACQHDPDTHNEVGEKWHDLHDLERWNSWSQPASWQDNRRPRSCSRSPSLSKPHSIKSHRDRGRSRIRGRVIRLIHAAMKGVHAASGPSNPIAGPLPSATGPSEITTLNASSSSIGGAWKSKGKGGARLEEVYRSP
jgi:hypothetical protein